MFTFWSIAAAVMLLLQAGDIPLARVDIFNPKEQEKLEKEENVEKRIKVYESASKRIQKSLETAVKKEEFQTVPDQLKLWTSLLSMSLKDIEANLKKKKKSRPLIRYETHVRKSIASTKNLKIRAPVDQQNAFDSCIEQAEEVREKFMDILFPQ